MPLIASVRYLVTPQGKSLIQEPSGVKFLMVRQTLGSESHPGGFCWVLRKKEYFYQKNKVERSFSGGNDLSTDPIVRAGCGRIGERASDTRHPLGTGLWCLSVWER